MSRRRLSPMRDGCSNFVEPRVALQPRCPTDVLAFRKKNIANNSLLKWAEVLAEQDEEGAVGEPVTAIFC